MLLLYTGSNQIGKLHAAQFVASQLNQPLKYVLYTTIAGEHFGKTEKNLVEIFNQLQDQPSILFFDEADSLFEEVNDHHTRYSNTQVSYLLECLNRFKGIVIISTSLQHILTEKDRKQIKAIHTFTNARRKQELQATE